MSLKKLHPNVKIRILTSFLSRFVGTMIFPFMAIYFSVKFGQAAAGLLLILNIVVSIVTGFYGGYVADIVGRKKVMVVSQAILVAAYLMMAMANSPWMDSAVLTFIMMMIQSFCAGLLNPAAEAMLIDVSTKENRKFMFSLNYWSLNLSVALGSLLGGLLFASYRFELFLALTIVSLFNLYLMSMKMKESHQHVRKIDKKGLDIIFDMLHTYRSVMRDRLFLLFCLAGVLVLSLEFQTNNFIAVRLEKEFGERALSFLNFDFQLSGINMLSIINTENTIMCVALTLVMTAWMKRYNDEKVLYLGILLFTIGYVVQGFSNSVTILIAAVFVKTIGELMYVPVRESYLAELIKTEARSSYLAFNGLVFQSAKIVSALLVTLSAWVPSWFISLLLLFLGVGSIVVFNMVIQKKKQPTSNMKEEWAV